MKERHIWMAESTQTPGNWRSNGRPYHLIVCSRKPADCAVSGGTEGNAPPSQPLQEGSCLAIWNAAFLFQSTSKAVKSFFLIICFFRPTERNCSEQRHVQSHLRCGRGQYAGVGCSSLGLKRSSSDRKKKREWKRAAKSLRASRGGAEVEKVYDEPRFRKKEQKKTFELSQSS